MGSRLYQNVQDFERTWNEERLGSQIRTVCAIELLAIVSNNTPETNISERLPLGNEYMRCLLDISKSLFLHATIISDTLIYLDREWVAENRKPSCFTLVTSSFRDHFLRLKPFAPMSEMSVVGILVAIVTDQICLDRKGYTIDKRLLRRCVGRLREINSTDEEERNDTLYDTELEPKFVRTSEEFFIEERKMLLQKDTHTWLQTTQRWIIGEADRCRTTLWGATYQQGIKVVEAKLIGEYL
jgi:cullin 3